MSSGKCKLKQQWDRYHYTPIRVTKIQNTDNTKCWQGCGTIETLIHRWWECKNGTCTLEDSLVVSYKTKHTLTIQSSNCTPRYLPKGTGNLCPHKNLHMFITALFIIAKTWKQPKCPLVDEWINKLWYIQTTEYYSVLKRKEMSY